MNLLEIQTNSRITIPSPNSKNKFIATPDGSISFAKLTVLPHLVSNSNFTTKLKRPSPKLHRSDCNTFKSRVNLSCEASPIVTNLRRKFGLKCTFLFGNRSIISQSFCLNVKWFYLLIESFHNYNFQLYQYLKYYFYFLLKKLFSNIGMV